MLKEDIIADTSDNHSKAKPIPSFHPAAQIRRLIENISKAFVGKETVTTQAVLALLAEGHVLLEDVPGLGKTLLAKAISKSISAEFKRIQFTADLLPSDISGVTIYSQERNEFSFRKGPVFTHILLGDEINRATPRTQSSLLEAMEESSVTVDGELYPLQRPFFVMATQNPIELEGTYPLPFAQMDRFMIRLKIGYLNREEEIKMVRMQQHSTPVDSLTPVMDCTTLTRIQNAVCEIRMEDQLRGYLVDLVRATRECEALEYGASPRGCLDLQRYSQAIALLDSREFILPDDIKTAARLLLPHRLIVKRGTRSVTANASSLIKQIIDSVPVPV
ncbi:MAG TPA: MoxR family ATPase [Verrucomicrobiales bacterium]|nr:MoxR family ATPase [Verrucomicrobiales bacterium]HIL71700.1 MoxR family ATPase [Verrucomicrobiota bacterium]